MFTHTKRLFVLLYLVASCQIGASASNLYNSTAEQLHAEFASQLNPFRMNNSLEILIDFNENLHKVNYKVIDDVAKNVVAQEDGFRLINKRFLKPKYSNNLTKSVLWQNDFSLMRDLLRLSYLLSLASETDSDMCGYFYDPPGLIKIRSLRAGFLSCLSSALEVQNDEKIRTPLQIRDPFQLKDGQYDQLRGNSLILLNLCIIYAHMCSKTEWFLPAKTKQYYDKVRRYKPVLLKARLDSRGLFTTALKDDYIETAVKVVVYKNIDDDIYGSPNQIFSLFNWTSIRIWRIKEINRDILGKLSDVGDLFVQNMGARFNNIKIRKGREKERLVAKLVMDALRHNMHESHQSSPGMVIQSTSLTVVADIVTHFSAHLVEYGLHHGFAQIITNAAAALSFAAAGTFSMPILATLALVEGTLTVYELYESHKTHKQAKKLKPILSIDLYKYSEVPLLHDLFQCCLQPRQYAFSDYEKGIICSLVIRAIKLGAKYEEIIEATLNQKFIVDFLDEL